MRRIVNLLSCVDGPRKNKTKIKISMRKKNRVLWCTITEQSSGEDSKRLFVDGSRKIVITIVRGRSTKKQQSNYYCAYTLFYFV
jgi:hypothetical protein